ncbi:MAG: hypothetical protein IKV32_03465 [Muribaculaceae bacterium]|nr:hypothetical protein [Muribaculaceae bacterium]
MKNDMETKNHKKPMIEYLDIDENIYIENDELKMRINESNGNDIGTWDDIWDGILKIIEKVREYDETHNTNK